MTSTWYCQILSKKSLLLFKSDLPSLHYFVESDVVTNVTIMCKLINMISLNRFISLEVNYYVKFIKTQPKYYLKLDVWPSIRGLHQKKLVLSSSNSWCDGKPPRQESSEFLDELDDSNNIKFTYEVEQGGQLPFLDLLLNTTENGGLKLQIYRKPTHTDQYLNFSSHHPIEHKLSVVKTLWKRRSLCASLQKLKIENRKISM